MIRNAIGKILITASCFLTTSCWIYPEYKEYTSVGNSTYFENYETMRSVAVPKINSTFSAWHWSNDEFDKKYKKYLNNIEPNQDDLEYMNENNYSFCFKVVPSNQKVLLKDNKKSIAKECFWITEKSGKSVVFYQN